MIIWSYVLNCVADDVVMTCFWCFVVYWTHNQCNKSFWVFGGSKGGFWMRKRLWNRRFLVYLGEASLKRRDPSLKRATIVVAQNSEKLVRSSERQANKNLTFVIWFAQANFPSLKRNLPRTCSKWASLKRTPSEPQARNTQTFVNWIAQARSCSLKRDGSCATILCNFSKCS